MAHVAAVLAPRILPQWTHLEDWQCRRSTRSRIYEYVYSYGVVALKAVVEQRRDFSICEKDAERNYHSAEVCRSEVRMFVFVSRSE